MSGTKYRVVVRRYDGTDEQVIGTYDSERMADRCERGAMRNLDHEYWYTEVEEISG